MASGEETKARREIRRALQTAGVQTDGASLAALAEWVVPRARESGSTVRAAAFEAADSAVPHASCAGVLEAAGAHAAVASLGKAREESGSQSVGFTKRVAVADCFNRARLIWDSTRRTFHPQNRKPTFLGEPHDKASLYEQRLRILEERTSRHRLFCQPVVRQHGLDSGRCELTPIGGLASCASEGPHFVLATLSHVRGDECVLEDASGCVDARIDNAQSASGLLTDGCIVLAEGTVEKENRRNPMLHVSALGMPPAEQREDTVAAFPGFDLSGTGTSVLQQSPADLEALQEEEQRSGGAVCVMSDVYLDDDRVHKRLLSFIDGCASSNLEPQVIALLGNLSRSSDLRKLREGLFTLGEGVVSEARRTLPSTTIVIVPGSNDFVPYDALPYPPLLELLRSALNEGFASSSDDAQPDNVVFATNPVKLRALTHEIALLRLDLQATARCHCVRKPVEEDVEDDNDASEAETQEAKRLRHLCSTLVRQAHMCPLPLDAQPIAWALDGALSLDPAPHGLVIADSSELQAATSADDVAVSNPGSFVESGEFALYRIPDGKMELCQVAVPDEDDELTYDRSGAVAKSTAAADADALHDNNHAADKNDAMVQEDYDPREDSAHEVGKDAGDAEEAADEEQIVCDAALMKHKRGGKDEEKDKNDPAVNDLLQALDDEDDEIT